jgi:NADH dehydrogenase
MIMDNKTKEGKKKIVVVGGGFAGLKFVQQLFNNRYYDVTLVDKNNYNYFTPLLYQVATGFLDASSISYPFRKLFRGKGIEFRLAEVISVDTARQIVYLDQGELIYDHLVFAAGAKPNFFGNESVTANAIPLKGIEDALFMRNELVSILERAAIETDPMERRKLLTIVVAGGGPTGVEVAGMLAEMKNHIIEKDYPELKGARGKILIVDGNPVLLAPMSKKTQKETYSALIKMGVKIKLNTLLLNYMDDQVSFSDGDVVATKTLIWCAGITAHTFEGIPESSLGIGNRMKTDGFNRVHGLQNVYAIGDISVQQTDDLYPKGHPQLAQPAIQQGRTLAKNLLVLAKGKIPMPFKYFDRGDMAIVGRHHAVADLFKNKVHLSGFLGLLGWLFIHLISLVSYDNKIKTLYGWIVAYLTKDQSLRMLFKHKQTKETVNVE